MSRRINEGLATAPTFTPHRVNVNVADIDDYRGLRASLDLDTVTVNVDTIIEDTDVGISNKTIAFVQDGEAPSAGVLTNVGDDYIFTFPDGVTTVADFEAALGTGIRVKTAGTGTNVLAVTDDEFTAEPLVDGADGIPMLHGMMSSEFDEVVADVKINGSDVDLKVLMWSDMVGQYVDQNPAVEWSNLTDSVNIRFRASGQRFFIWVGGTFTRVDIDVAGVPLGINQQA